MYTSLLVTILRVMISLDVCCLGMEIIGVDRENMFSRLFTNALILY